MITETAGPGGWSFAGSGTEGRGASIRTSMGCLDTRDGARADKRSAFDCTGNGSSSGAPAAAATWDAEAGDETLKRRTGNRFELNAEAAEENFALFIAA